MPRPTAPQSSFAISAQVSQKDINRALRTLDKYQGAELHKRTEKAIRGGATLLKGPIAAASPVRSGRMRSSVGVKKLRKQQSEVTAYYVGPRTFYAQWIQDGTKRGVEANPFVERATAPRLSEVHNFIDQQIRRLA